MILYIDFSIGQFKIGNFLNQKEQACAAAFRSKHLQDCYIFSHSFKRFILTKRFLLCDPRAWQFNISAAGKPYVDFKALLHSSSVPTTPFTFNLSHSDKAVALSSIEHDDQNTIGIDIELFKSIDDLDDISNVMFHGNERQLLLGYENKEKGFFRIWTAKEALLKAFGSGITDDIKHLNCGLSLKNSAYTLEWKHQRYYIQTIEFSWGVISVSWLEKVAVSDLKVVDWSGGKPVIIDDISLKVIED